MPLSRLVWFICFHLPSTAHKPCHCCLQTSGTWTAYQILPLGFRDDELDTLLVSREALSDYLICLDRDACLELFGIYGQTEHQIYRLNNDGPPENKEVFRRAIVIVFSGVTGR